MINKGLPWYIWVIVGEKPISRIPNPQVASSILAGGTKKSEQAAIILTSLFLGLFHHLLTLHPFTMLCVLKTLTDS